MYYKKKRFNNKISTNKILTQRQLKKYIIFKHGEPKTNQFFNIKINIAKLLKTCTLTAKHFNVLIFISKMLYKKIKYFHKHFPNLKLSIKQNEHFEIDINSNEDWILKISRAQQYKQLYLQHFLITNVFAKFYHYESSSFLSNLLNTTQTLQFTLTQDI